VTPSPCRGPDDGRRPVGPAPVDGRDRRPGVLAREPRPGRASDPPPGARLRAARHLDRRGHGVPPGPAARHEQAGGGEAPADPGGRGLRRGGDDGRRRRAAQAVGPHPARTGRRRGVRGHPARHRATLGSDRRPAAHAGPALEPGSGGPGRVGRDAAAGTTGLVDRRPGRRQISDARSRTGRDRDGSRPPRRRRRPGRSAGRRRPAGGRRCRS
jgi:hypothetical protein